MNRPRPRPGLVALAAAAVLVATAAFQQPARAQAPSVDVTPSTPADVEALARAQRAADRVKQFILMNAKFDAAPPSSPRPVAVKAAARPATSAAPAVTRPARLAAPQAAQVIAGGAPSAAAPLGLEATGTRVVSDAALLFDFETSTEGFTLHKLAEWVELPALALTLTPQAAHGQYALQATSPSDAWLGVDLSDSVDFSGLKRITFSLRSAHGAVGRLAIKSGSQYDWCELRPSAVGGSDGFTRYEILLQAKGRECRNLDLEDVRGLHWFVRAGDVVTLDYVRLQ
jgi:hypothetical protein